MNAVERKGLTPNFWTSEEYIERRGLEWRDRGEFAGFVDPDFPQEWFLPPLRDGEPSVHGNIWATFVGFEHPEANTVFLDFNFIYFAGDFHDLRGSRWKTFRKNVRKYPDRYSRGRALSYRDIEPGNFENEITEMLERWADGKEIEDVEVMVDYLFHGRGRKGLFNGERLVGLNVFDVNGTFINFRYCLDDGTPYLNEYLRWAFYRTLPWGVAVNDGGVLGNAGLEKYKKKLNPRSVHHIYSQKGRIVQWQKSNTW